MLTSSSCVLISEAFLVAEGRREEGSELGVGKRGRVVLMVFHGEREGFCLRSIFTCSFI